MMEKPLSETLTLLGDRVLIEPEKADEKTTASGLVLASKTPAGVPLKGQVVAVGSGKTNAHGDIVPMQVSVGDKVLFPQGAGQKIKLDGEEYVLVYESEIFAIEK